MIATSTAAFEERWLEERPEQGAELCISSCYRTLSRRRLLVLPL